MIQELHKVEEIKRQILEYIIYELFGKQLL